MRGEHEKAVVFLQRSLKLNPNNAAAWTLIGHEFMEQKNNPAACLAYRKAIGIFAIYILHFTYWNLLKFEVILNSETQTTGTHSLLLAAIQQELIVKM